MMSMALMKERQELAAVKARRVMDYVLECRHNQKWLRLGHGEYTEMFHEGDLFHACSRSPHVVVFLYKSGSECTKIVDHHMKILMDQHIECRFISINGDRCPFLISHFALTTLPAVLVIREAILEDLLINFPAFYSTGGMATNMLRRVLCAAGVIKLKLNLAMIPLRRGPWGYGNPPLCVFPCNTNNSYQQ